MSPTWHELVDRYFAESPRTLEEGYRFTATDWVHHFAGWCESQGFCVVRDQELA